MGSGTLPHPDMGLGEGHCPSCEPGPARNVLGYWQPMSRNRRQQAFLRCATKARISDFRSTLTRCCSFDGPREGASEWRRKRKAKGPVRPMTTDRAPISRLTRAFCGLQKLSADSLLANRLSRRPSPMTTNRRHDRDRFFSYSFISSVRLHRWQSDSRSKTGRDGVWAGAGQNKHLDGGGNFRIDVKA
jgi:hypothetical protein